MVDVPGDRQKIEHNALQLFKASSAWKSEEGSLRRSLANGTMFEVLDVGNNKYQPTVKLLGELPDYCDGRSFPTQEEAKEYAWICFRGRLLSQAVSAKEPPEAEIGTM